MIIQINATVYFVNIIPHFVRIVFWWRPFIRTDQKFRDYQKGM